jgi:serine/threonine protein phosphatase PrpC
MTILHAAYSTDIGMVRTENEDRYLCDEETQLFGVADGVGGLPGGAEAAQETVSVVSQAVHAAGPHGDLKLAPVVVSANDAVAALGRKLSPGLGIGSTLTLGCVRHGKLFTAHVGDSRAYFWRKGEFRCLTEDHSVENEAKRRRAKGEVVYYSEGQRGALTRCIGQTVAPEVDVSEMALLSGDRVLFCTDGVTRLIPDSQVGEILGASDDPAVITRGLVALAVLRGGPDNATAVAVVIDSP